MVTAISEQPIESMSYKEINDEAARLRLSMVPRLRDQWDAYLESVEWFDGESQIELAELRHFIKTHS